jgi:hypothetical protein
MRNILIRVATGETCTADEYEAASTNHYKKLSKLLALADAPFYKNVQVVHSLEAEASYEPSGIEIEVLVELEGTEKGTPDIAKPQLQKVVQKLYTKGQVLSKKVVPNFPAPPQ